MNETEMKEDWMKLKQKENEWKQMKEEWMKLKQKKNEGDWNEGIIHERSEEWH